MILSSGFFSRRLANRPVVEDRKSGMPEAVLMPAPTMKATFLLRATWRARLCSSDSPTEPAGATATRRLLVDANASPKLLLLLLLLPALPGASSWMVRIAILAAGAAGGRN